MENIYVMGLEFGTDSCRALLVNALTGEEIDTEVAYYPRWMQGLYTDKQQAQFRHHPKDYLETLQSTVCAITSRHPEEARRVKGLALDTTASTVCMADRQGRPLALQEKYAEEPDAMFVIWKDHTGHEEADHINALLEKSEVNYAKFTGNNYSAECFWAKVWHMLRGGRIDPADAWTAIEVCDFIPALLSGYKDASEIKQGHCVTAAKWMWSEEWGGYPPEEFFNALDPILIPLRSHLSQQNYGAHQCVGHLCAQWAQTLGLPEGIAIGAGNVDSHSGAVGGGIQYGTMVMNLGTSACYMSVMPKEEMGGRIVDGVFGQVDGSILDGMVGFESGLSAMGDVFAWFKSLMSWPIKSLLGHTETIDAGTRGQLAAEMEERILGQLSEEAEKLHITVASPLATDWFNGRRSPFSDHSLKATITSMDLSTSAADIYYALAEATAFATKRVIDHLQKFGVVIDKLIGIGGIAQKSPLMMQLIADVLERDLPISDCKQAGAMGSIIHAATVAGIYPSVTAAQDALCRPCSRIYKPNAQRTALLLKRYQRYLDLGGFTEKEQKIVR